MHSNAIDHVQCYGNNTLSARCVRPVHCPTSNNYRLSIQYLGSFNLSLPVQLFSSYGMCDVGLTVARFSQAGSKCLVTHEVVSTTLLSY